MDDGSTDGSTATLRREAERRRFPLTLIEQASSGPAAARNRALEVARAPVCLFIDDDSWPRPPLLRRHRDFHAARPEPQAALLGHIDVAPQPPPTPFMRWLAELHLDFAGIEDPEDAGGGRFFTGNVSAKTEFLRSVGGFDETRVLSHEDIDLGLRLEQRGMVLVYDRDAVVDHYQPLDLPRAITRLHRIGRSGAALAASAASAGRPVPRRPGLRHRVKAAALTVLAVLPARTARIQRETWRFLCHEATREGYWDAIDGRDSAEPLRIGRTLARIAGRDADAQMPGSPA